MRRLFIKSFIGFWIAFHLLIPAVNKFQLPKCQYHRANFSWSMYSRPKIGFEVELFKETPAGRTPIKNIKKYISDEKGIMTGATYFEVEQLQAWYARLVNRIAKDNEGDYGVSIRWARVYRSDIPDLWEYKARHA